MIVVGAFVVGVPLGFILTFVSGCADDPDPRFATPEATVTTLLGAYGVQQMSEEEIQRHMRDRGHFELRDEMAYQACFSDYGGPQDEGAAGYVFGLLAARKDNLQVIVTDDNAHIFPNRDRRDQSVYLEREQGAWRIQLARSVPEDVRTQLREIFLQAQRRARRLGAPE